MVLDERIFPEEFGPPVVCLTKDASEDASTDAQYDKDKVVDGVIVDTVVCLEEDKFACGCWVELFEGGCCDERAEECFPQYGAWKVRADFLR